MFTADLTFDQLKAAVENYLNANVFQLEVKVEDLVLTPSGFTAACTDRVVRQEPDVDPARYGSSGFITAAPYFLNVTGDPARYGSIIKAAPSYDTAELLSPGPPVWCNATDAAQSVFGTARVPNFRHA